MKWGNRPAETCRVTHSLPPNRSQAVTSGYALTCRHYPQPEISPFPPENPKSTRSHPKIPCISPQDSYHSPQDTVCSPQIRPFPCWGGAPMITLQRNRFKNFKFCHYVKKTTDLLHAPVFRMFFCPACIGANHFLCETHCIRHRQWQ